MLFGSFRLFLESVNKLEKVRLKVPNVFPPFWGELAKVHGIEVENCQKVKISQKTQLIIMKNL